MTARALQSLLSQGRLAASSWCRAVASVYCLGWSRVHAYFCQAAALLTNLQLRTQRAGLIPTYIAFTGQFNIVRFSLDVSKTRYVSACLVVCVHKSCSTLCFSFRLILRSDHPRHFTLIYNSLRCSRVLCTI